MRWIFVLITTWLVFVLSLSAWWMIFGLNNLEMLSMANLEEGSRLVRHQKMLFYEGLVLVVSLVLGGGGLFYFTWRMYQEKSTTEKFFASFTHDLKTSLFRLQLQVEKLEDSLNQPLSGSHPETAKVSKVTTDSVAAVLASTRRLNLHLENGLDSALGGRQNLYLEAVDLSEFLSDLHAEWPELEIQLKGHEQVKADKKALRSIFKNLLHNSFLHGKADQVTLVLQHEVDRVLLRYSDNGEKFVGRLESLGQAPQTSAKGSGFGLYLVRYWLLRMQGEIRFDQAEGGQLLVQMWLPRSL